MTPEEQTAYTFALWELRGDWIFQNFVDIHEDDMMIAHGNERFLPWHRIFLQAFEDSLKNVYPEIAIPYWDWRSDRDTTDLDFWHKSSFLGQFNEPWDLNRSFSTADILPTANDVESVMNLTSFITGTPSPPLPWYFGSSNNGFGGIAGTHASVDPLRRGNLELIHNTPHGWVGGDMNQLSTSPNDPVFYLHHSMVDMLWQVWEDDKDATEFSSSSLNFGEFGTRNPYDYINSRDLKIWYAKDGEVVLDQYESNGSENYNYTGKIYAGNEFIVKSGSEVSFVAGTQIELGPGFKVETGSIFSAYIDPDVGKIQLQIVDETPVVDRIETPEMVNQPVVWSLSQNYPNPFNPTTSITFSVKERSHVKVSVYTITGQQVYTLVDEIKETGTHTVQFDASRFASGLYIYRIQAGGFVQSRQMTLIK